MKPTTRLWMFHPRRYTQDSKYTLGGKSVVNFQERSKRENVIEVLRVIREENGEKTIVMIVDNFAGHKAEAVQREAEKLGIHADYKKQIVEGDA